MGKDYKEYHLKEIKRRVLDSTRKLYNQLGPAATTEEICREAKIGKGTLFHYFENKENLFWEAFLDAREHAQEITCQDVDWDADTDTILRQMVRSSLNWAVNFPEEVLFSQNYNMANRKVMVNQEFHQQVPGIFDDPRLGGRVKAKIADSELEEYVIMSANMEAFTLVYYIAEDTERIQNKKIIDFAVNRICGIFNSRKDIFLQRG